MYNIYEIQLKNIIIDIIRYMLWERFIKKQTKRKLFLKLKINFNYCPILLLLTAKKIFPYITHVNYNYNFYINLNLFLLLNYNSSIIVDTSKLRNKFLYDRINETIFKFPKIS